MIPNLDWLADAACAGMDSRAFFANGCHARAQVHEAKKICASCPVQPNCAAFAIETGERWGVWGGDEPAGAAQEAPPVHQPRQDQHQGRGMNGPWQGGLQVRGLDLGETPVADFLCGTCLDHKRATGRRKVAEFLRDNPVTAHGPHCRPAAKTT